MGTYFYDLSHPSSLVSLLSVGFLALLNFMSSSKVTPVLFPPPAITLMSFITYLWKLSTWKQLSFEEKNDSALSPVRLYGNYLRKNPQILFAAKTWF